MKKIIFFVFTAFFIFGISQAGAYDFQLEAGDQVKWDGSHVGPGGEFGFSVVGATENTGFTWSTFCVEYNEHLYSNTTMTVDGLSNSNTSGTGTLTDTVAWLYWNFSEGTLNNYYNTNNNIYRNNQKRLQELIWYELDQRNYYSHQAQGWLTQATTAVGSGWTNNGRVQIVQLGDYQDVLIAGTDQNPVPEPTTMALFGFGLISLAAVGRKKIM